MELMKNKVYRCRISDYTADGTGFAKIEGRAVFVPRTAVGDCCDVRIVKVTKNVAFGRVEKLVTPSRARITPACPVSDKCGGCCYQHITYEEELRAKEKKVRDALTRIGKQDGDRLLGITGAETTEHYRNKAQYPVGRDREGNIVTGFYRPRSHDIVPVERCLIQSEKADHLAGIVREWMTEFAVPPYDYETKRGTIRHIYVRTGEKSGECQLTLISALTIGVPSFFLALEPNHDLVKGKFLHNVLRRAFPGGLTAIFVILFAELFVYTFDLTLAELSTICVILMAVNGLMVIYYAARPLDAKRLVLLVAMSAAMFVAVVFYGAFFSLSSLSFAAWLVLIVLVLLVVPIQMGLEWCFDRCTTALDRRRERLAKRRRAPRRPRPAHRSRRRR